MPLRRSRGATQANCPSAAARVDGKLEQLRPPLYATISCSGLVAEEDRVMPPENSHQLGRLIPKATLVQIPQCGHLPMWEKPRAYADAMFQFLQL